MCTLLALLARPSPQTSGSTNSSGQKPRADLRRLKHSNTLARPNL